MADVDALEKAVAEGREMLADRAANPRVVEYCATQENFGYRPRYTQLRYSDGHVESYNGLGRTGIVTEEDIDWYANDYVETAIKQHDTRALAKLKQASIEFAKARVAIQQVHFQFSSVYGCVIGQCGPQIRRRSRRCGAHGHS